MFNCLEWLKLRIRILFQAYFDDELFYKINSPRNTITGAWQSLLQYYFDGFGPIDFSDTRRKFLYKMDTKVLQYICWLCNFSSLMYSSLMSILSCLWAYQITLEYFRNQNSLWCVSYELNKCQQEFSLVYFSLDSLLLSLWLIIK